MARCCAAKTATLTVLVGVVPLDVARDDARTVRDAVDDIIGQLAKEGWDVVGSLTFVQHVSNLLCKLDIVLLRSKTGSLCSQILLEQLVSDVFLCSL